MAEVFLQGTTNGTSSATGDIIPSVKALGGSSQPGSETSAALKTVKLLGGTSTAGSSVAGGVSARVGLGGQSAGAGSVAADLDKRVGLAGNANGHADVTAPLSVKRTLQAESHGYTRTVGGLRAMSPNAEDAYMQITGAPVFNNDADPATGNPGTYTIPVTLRRSLGSYSQIPNGAAVVRWGKSGVATGVLEMTSEDANSPYLRVFSLASTAPWLEASQTEHVRVGQLAGVLGLSSQWGIAAGQDLSDVNKPYFKASDLGVRLSNVDMSIINGDFYAGDSAKTKFVKWDKTTGTLSVKGEILADTGTLGNLSIAGLLSIGTSGEIRQGTGTLGTDFTGLRIWNESGIGKIAGYNAGVPQWYAGSDGSFYAGEGAVKISDHGIEVSAYNYDLPFMPQYTISFGRDTVCQTYIQQTFASAGVVPNLSMGQEFTIATIGAAQGTYGDVCQYFRCVDEGSKHLAHIQLSAQTTEIVSSGWLDLRNDKLVISGNLPHYPVDIYGSLNLGDADAPATRTAGDLYAAGDIYPNRKTTGLDERVTALEAGGGGGGGGGAPYVWSIEGTLAAATSVCTPLNILARTVLGKVSLYINTLGTSGTTTIDINKNGTTIFTTQANRPALAYNAAQHVVVSLPDVVTLQEGDVLTLDIDSAATGASGMTVQLVGPTATEDAGAVCRVTRTTVQSIPNATVTPVSFDTVTNTYTHGTGTDDTNLFWSATYPTRLTAKKAGWYMAGMSSGFTGHTATWRHAAKIMLYNSAGTLISDLAQNENNPAPNTFSYVDVHAGAFYMHEGDYVVFGLYQNTGSAKDTALPSQSSQNNLSAYIFRVWDYGSATATGLMVQETDGSPVVAAKTLIVPNGTLTDNGNETVTFNPTVAHAANHRAGGSDPVPQWYWLQYAVTSTSWALNPRSTTAKTLIDISSVFPGIPKGVKAIQVRALARDSGSSGSTSGYYAIFCPNGDSGKSAFTIYTCGVPNDTLIEQDGVIPCNADGNIYFQCQSSGTGTLDVWLEIWGYYI